MKPCCGNCKHWVDAKPTAKGHLPYFGNCDAGRPLKKGQFFKRGEYRFRYATFKIRSDRACKDYEMEEMQSDG